MHATNPRCCTISISNFLRDTRCAVRPRFRARVFLCLGPGWTVINESGRRLLAILLRDLWTFLLLLLCLEAFDRAALEPVLTTCAYTARR